MNPGELERLGEPDLVIAGLRVWVHGGQLRAAQDVLASIHVPGERTPPGFKVYGYMRPATVLGYVPKPDSSFK
jgi:hypothetical protein